MKPIHKFAFSTALLIAALATAGCSTTTIADLQAKPPREIYSSMRPVDDIARCLTETLGRLGVPSSYARPDGATILHFTIENEPTAVFTLRAGTVEVRTLSKIIPFRERTKQCVGAEPG